MRYITTSIQYGLMRNEHAAQNSQKREIIKIVL